MRTALLGQRWKYGNYLIAEICFDDHFENDTLRKYANNKARWYGKVVQAFDSFYYLGKQIRDPEEYLESFTYLEGQDAPL